VVNFAGRIRCTGRKRHDRRTWALASLITILVASPARAQPSDEDTTLALRLFDEGRALLAAGKVDEACPKLEESRRLYPLPGTLLNVAVCHEMQGRAATAVAEFREARALAERDHRDDRVALADRHLQALDGKVSSLVIVVPPEVALPDLSVTRDGMSIGRAAWGTRIPVDPGLHTIEASATSKKAWKLVITVAPAGDVETATLTPLEDAAPPPPAAPLAIAPLLAVPPAAQAPAPPPDHRGISTRRTFALVTTGAAVVAAGIGTYFGVTALSKHNDPAATCTLQPCTSADALNSDAKNAADASTVSFAVALVALGTGALLWFGDANGRANKATMAVTPDVAWGRAGLDLAGKF
jgi:hypothetical protein